MIIGVLYKKITPSDGGILMGLLSFLFFGWSFGWSVGRFVFFGFAGSSFGSWIVNRSDDLILAKVFVGKLNTLWKLEVGNGEFGIDTCKFGSVESDFFGKIGWLSLDGNFFHSLSEGKVVELGSVGSLEIYDDDRSEGFYGFVGIDSLELNVDDFPRNWVDGDRLHESEGFLPINIKVDWGVVTSKVEDTLGVVVDGLGEDRVA